MRRWGMKKFKIGVLTSVFLLFIFVLAACGGEDDTAEGEKTTFTVGTSPGPYSELFLDGIKPILEDQGYTVEDVDFTELLQADIALDEGSVDLNVDQHTAFMENFNEEKGADLVALTPIPTVPTGIYPGEKSSLDDIDAGDVVGIPNDPSNAARAYALLQKADLIKIKDDVELVKATQQDIEENYKDIKITEMDSAQIPRSMDDLDYGVIPGSIVYSSGLDASTSLLSEDILKELELVVVVNGDDEDSEWAQAVKDAYESDEFKEYMEEHNDSDYWFIPEELQ